MANALQIAFGIFFTFNPRSANVPSVKFSRLFLLLACFTFAVRASATESIARVWNEQILSAIRIDTPHPPVHARNLFHLSVVMYDAWAAYDNIAVGYIYHGKAAAVDVAAARHQAISYAAYRMLKERYALSRNATNTLAILDAQMTSLGYNTNNVSIHPATPAGLGNLVAATVSAYFINDGARQTNSYQDYPSNQGGYTPFNPPLVTGTNGTLVIGYVSSINVWGVNRWQPLAITNALDQTGYPVGAVQSFLGAHWIGVRPFAMSRASASLPWIDPGIQPCFNQMGNAQFRAEVVDLITKSSYMTPDDGVMMDISPGAVGNNTLGTNDGAGHPVNPATGLPYSPNVVKRGDFARVLSEFWADGPTSETPPGHWNTIANYIADYPGFEKRIGGTGPTVDDLEWDVKVYFAMNASTHDAACAAWTLKRYYDGGRPIESIRYMAQNGQSSSSGMSSYNTNGLPLINNLIELVTQFSAQTNQRHAGLPIGSIAIRTWPGEPSDVTNQYSGVKWIRGDKWYPYQRASFVTPAFPGHISGHSTFSRAAAEVLTAMTGSPFFPGGIGTYTAPSNTFLKFERGPSQTVQMQWATYFDAADQAGLSRLYGGIHPSADDLAGRRAGAQCGKSAWALARQYFDGSVLTNSVSLSIRSLTATQCELRYNTLRGFSYKLQSTASLELPFTDISSTVTQAVDTAVIRMDNPPNPNMFYRVVRNLVP